MKLLLHWWLLMFIIRSLTINECLKLFGFPENYSLNNIKKSEALDLLGNTVCIPVIRAVSSRLIESYVESVKFDENQRTTRAAY